MLAPILRPPDPEFTLAEDPSLKVKNIYYI
jgi:hypothetical protein